MERCCRVVLTGGPGGGKTTAADLYRREEAATILHLGGFPRSKEEGVPKSWSVKICRLSLRD